GRLASSASAELHCAIDILQSGGADIQPPPRPQPPQPPLPTDQQQQQQQWWRASQQSAVSAVQTTDALWLAAHTQPAEGCSHGFLVMELCEGGSLDAWRRAVWRAPGQLPDMAVLLSLARDVSQGMAFIHQHGVCHG
ncbi:hypothetical protein TSOC_002409, partial [Tetrabaena socialis]